MLEITEKYSVRCFCSSKGTVDFAVMGPSELEEDAAAWIDESELQLPLTVKHTSTGSDSVVANYWINNSSVRRWTKCWTQRSVKCATFPQCTQSGALNNVRGRTVHAAADLITVDCEVWIVCIIIKRSIVKHLWHTFDWGFGSFLTYAFNSVKVTTELPSYGLWKDLASASFTADFPLELQQDSIIYTQLRTLPHVCLH